MDGVLDGGFSRWIDTVKDKQGSGAYLQEVAVGLALLHGVGGPQAERAHEEDCGWCGW